jgi:diguanylate cyclase (GGDEF)-like protein
MLGDRVAVALATATRDEQLYYQANYDALTGLPNRMYFKDQLARRLAHAQREPHPFALLFIDLDRFKNVNDARGHAAGDEVLRQTAERLRRCVRETDTVTRLGGDEFTIILSQIRSAARPEAVAVNMRERSHSRSRSAAASSASARASASLSTPQTERPPTSCCATPTPRCIAPRRAGGGGYMYHEDKMNVAAHTRVSTRARIARRGRAQRIRTLVSSDARHAQRPHRRRPKRCCAGSVPDASSGFPSISADRGGDRRHRTHRRMDADGSLPAIPAWQAAGIAVPRIAVDVSARQFRHADSSSSCGGSSRALRLQRILSSSRSTKAC